MKNQIDMKKVFLLVFLPKTAFAGGSGIVHALPELLYVAVIFVVAIIGFVFYFIYWIIAYNTKPSRRNWYKDRDKITKFLRDYKMVFSDMETGVILYKNKEKRLEVNKYQNQWFIKGEKEKLQSKGVLKAYKSVEELNQALMKLL